MATSQITIGRMAARCRERTEPLPARLRISHLLQGADLAPAGLPPQAVLVVRRATAPEKVALGALRMRPGWERGMRDVIEGFWRSAVRPVRGRVQAEAEAVLFGDVGEWLACLGVAVTTGAIEQEWCRQTLPGAGAAVVSDSGTLARTWASMPRYVPAAVKHLANWGEAARVLKLLRPSEAEAVLSAIGAEFGLPRTSFTHGAGAALLEPKWTGDSTTERSRRDGANTGRRTAIGGSSKTQAESAAAHAPENRSRKLVAPWRRWIPSLESGCELLPVPAQRLLAASVALFHAPAHARTEQFAQEVAAWIEHTPSTPERTAMTGRTEAPARPVVRAPAAAVVTREHVSDATRAGEGKAAGTHAAVDSDEQDERAYGNSKRVNAAKGDAHDAAARDAAPVRRDEAAHVSVDKVHAPASETRPDSEAATRHEEDASITAQPAWATDGGCETELGGVLFLLNLFVELGLPECFDDDFQLSKHVSGWGLAELLGRALLGTSHNLYERDPMWAMLAQLDGREAHEPVAEHLEIGEGYRMPAHWLRRFTRGELSVKVETFVERLVLRHEPGGFVISERPLNGASAAESAARETEHYREHGVNLRLSRTAEDAAHSEEFNFRKFSNSEEFNSKKFGDSEKFSDSKEFGDCEESGNSEKFDDSGKLSGLAGLPCGEAVRRWVHWTLPFLKYALACRLGSSVEIDDDEELARLLLVKRGRLFCTATHVDLVMSMRQVSLPVRCAGLDATPGWVRDLVRVVSFHYE